jgi:tRNA pseudouridine38-40 synthase
LNLSSKAIQESSKGRRGAVRPEGRAPRQVVQLTVAYHGKAFYGSQRQEGKRTVQGELERAIQEVVGFSVPAYLAGRTDQGVHAAGQVVSLADYRPDLRDVTVLKAINAHLPEDLAVTSVVRRPLGFHARSDARWREYRYRYWTGVRQPLAADVIWQRSESLDLDAMNAAARRFIGTHDVASFAGGGEGVPGSARQSMARGTVRTILICRLAAMAPWWGSVNDQGRLIELRIAADGFLPRMVRSITGALADIGRGARPVSWIDEMLTAKDRRLGPTTAPAHGLTLWRVGYDTDDPDDMSDMQSGGLTEFRRPRRRE